MRVGDVDDVDVLALLVVNDDRICLVAGVPCEDAVGLVRVLLALTVHREVTHTHGQRSGVPRIGDVVHVHPAEAGRVPALLVVGDQDVAGELRCVDVQGLDTLAWVAALFGLDEGNLFRVLHVGDVHHVHAVVFAGLHAPGGEVGVVLEDPDVGYLLRDDVLQPQLADHVDVLLGRREVPGGLPVLVRVTGSVGHPQASVRLRRGMREGDATERGGHR